jgi:hypothetical protein
MQALRLMRLEIDDMVGNAVRITFNNFNHRLEKSIGIESRGRQISK